LTDSDVKSYGGQTADASAEYGQRQDTLAFGGNEPRQKGMESIANGCEVEPNLRRHTRSCWRR